MIVAVRPGLNVDKIAHAASTAVTIPAIIGKGCLNRWKRELAKEGENAFPGHGRLAPDQERIRQLERENKILRQERDILKKAVAIFSHPSK